ncbi:MAG: GIY-YIG nuclease family protein [Verrucomicrobiae bacterium]|nr:GIY-YIG nuclease family protein [Verrucomicrobiae bacterium]
MAKAITDEDLDLLDELGVETEPTKSNTHSPREQRIIAGFEEIERFVEEHGRLPRHGEHHDIFERLYAVRLDRLRESEECRAVLEGRDPRGLLESSDGTSCVVREDEVAYRVAAKDAKDLSDEELLTALGTQELDGSDITELKHVRPTAEKRAAEEVAQRTACIDFDRFKPLFERVESDIRTGLVQTQPITAENRGIGEGDFFILNGITLHVAEMGEALKITASEVDRRLRIIFANGTESNLLLRSLQRAFYDDPSARRVVGAGEAAQLTFGGEFESDDVEAGTIYVLRSRSDDPFIAANRNVIHKIGVTGGDVKARIANAKKDPTYLLAEVEIVATYKLANINRKRLEALLHKFFSGARLDLELKDRFGFDVTPQEWFLVPLPMIEEAVEKLKAGTIAGHRYDLQTARIVAS